MPRSNSVSGGRAARRAAMSPKAVDGPVASTTAVAVPLTTEVPRKTVLRAVGELPRRFGGLRGLLLGRHGFARESGLLDVQILGLEQAGRRRHEIARPPDG